jgi:hypothetical protein
MRFGAVWTLGILFFLSFVGMVILRATTMPSPVDDSQICVFSEMRYASFLTNCLCGEFCRKIFLSVFANRHIYGLKPRVLCRAARYLYHFVNEIGARPIGSPQNKNATVQYILSELTKIQEASNAKYVRLFTIEITHIHGYL